MPQQWLKHWEKNKDIYIYLSQIEIVAGCALAERRSYDMWPLGQGWSEILWKPNEFPQGAQELLDERSKQQLTKREEGDSVLDINNIP